RLPSDAAMNQIPIICPTRSRGASLVIDDSPTGDRLNSPTVKRKYITTSQAGDALSVSVAFEAPHMITKKAVASKMSPSANLTGIEGLALRRANQTHNHPKIGANVMMKIGFIDCSQLAGISNPKNVRCVRSRAKM